MKLFPFLALATLVLTSGCSKPVSVIGKWKVDPALTGAGATPESKGFVIGFASTFHFEFKSDKTFEGAITKGTYSLEGNKLSMKTTEVLGQDVSKAPTAAGAVELKGELSEDGKTLILHPNFIDMMPDSMKNGVPMVRDGQG